MTSLIVISVGLSIGLLLFSLLQRYVGRLNRNPDPIPLAALAEDPKGTATMLHPSFSLLDVMQPFQKKAWLRRMSPSRRLKKMRRVYMEVEHLVEVLPRRMIDILEQVQSGTFDVHLDHRGLGPSVNRLVLGMLTSALFLGSTLMLSRQVPPLLFSTPTYLGMHNISLLGLSGCAVSILLGLRLIRAIYKSGHLDRNH